MNPVADLRYEYRLHEQGYQHVAGLDEAGRGAWAGPVVAGAVILPLDRFDLARVLVGVNDSKLLAPGEREALVPRILSVALATGVGYATNEEIDRVGIVPATRLAMQRALELLQLPPDVLLIDSLKLPDNTLPGIALIKGDQKSLSIAAASILAKVARDHHLDELDVMYPNYGFREHKGYGTKLHQHTLNTFGVTNAHRKTFAPVRALCENVTEDET